MDSPVSRRLFVRNSAVLLAGGALALSPTARSASTPAARTAPAASEPAGAALADELLAAMGGREAWAGVTFMHVEATHDDLSIRDPFTNRIWNDFSTFRVRFEARNAAFDSRRAVADGMGWRWRDGQSFPLTAEQVAHEQRWWEANVYRTLHRLATNDPDLAVRSAGPRRLEIFRHDGQRLNWFLLNQRGEPMLFGTWNSEAASVFGPLSGNGTIRYPRWGARPDGDFRYEIVRIETAGAVPSAVNFAAPNLGGAH
jgi:hypothetical protein